MCAQFRSLAACFWLALACAACGRAESSPATRNARAAPATRDETARVTTPEGWRPMSAAGAPVLRRGPISVFAGRELVIFGYQSADPDDNTWAEPGAYDPATDRWRAVSLVGAPKDRLFTFLRWLPSVGNVLMCDQLGTWCARYDPNADSWRSSAPPPAPPDARDWRSAYALEALGFHGYPNGAVAFSRAAETENAATLDVRTHVYDAPRDAWVAVEPPASRDVATSTSWTSMHGDAATAVLWDQPFVLDVERRAWLRSSPYGARWTVANASGSVHVSSIIRERPRVSGEPRGARPLELLLRSHNSDRSADEWCVALPAATGPRLDTGIVAEATFGACVILYASAESASSTLGRGHVCCPARGGFTCERMQTTGEPSFRRGFASAFTGTDLIVWGGFEPDGGRERVLECAGPDCAHTFRPVRDGALYRPPATHRGTAVPRCPAP